MKKDKENKLGLQFFGEAEDEVFDILAELSKDYHGLDVESELKIAQIAQLKRIADLLEDTEADEYRAASALERIDRSLEDINIKLGQIHDDTTQLAECVDETPSGYGERSTTFLRIAGTVSPSV